MNPNLAILSGEMSGDLVGGALARDLRTLQPRLTLWGMGSRNMADAGVELIHDSAAWGAIGVIEALKVYPELRFRVYPRILKELERRRPAAVILIDFGAFNVKVARWCKANRLPVFYYFPPSSWKRRGRQNPEIARITDCIATPFPWSADRLREVGARAEFVGHPLLDLVHPTLTRAQFADRFGMESGHPIIGLLPGSRAFEIEHNIPAMLGAARIIHQELPEAQFVFGLSTEQALKHVESALTSHREAVSRIEEMTHRADEETEIDRSLSDIDKRLGERSRTRLVTPEGVEIPADVLQKQEVVRRYADQLKSQYDLPPILLSQGMAYDVMAHSDALLVCSGTATLEAAILGTPMVIMYRGSRLMEIEAKVRHIKPEHIGLPNIIAQERIVPEFLQHDATPKALSEQVLRFLRDPTQRAEVKSALAKVRAALGTPGASERAARLALEVAGIPVTTT